MICAWNGPASCLQIESGRLQPQKTNVSGLLLGNGCSIFIVKGSRRMYGPMESLGQLIASWNRDQRYEIGDDIPRFRAQPIWLSNVEASPFAVAARGRERHL